MWMVAKTKDTVPNNPTAGLVMMAQPALTAIALHVTDIAES